MLYFIVILAFILRVIGINWDNGFHLHPDERMLIMVAERIRFFSNLNPDFFNYGSFPIYLLTAIPQTIDYLFKTHLATYGGMLYLGRMLSVLADTLTVLLVYKLALILFKDKNIAALGSFFYAIAFFPIQNAHFFVVDVFLNLFSTALILSLILYLKKPALKKVLLMALISALLVTTKFTGIIFLPVVLLTLILPVKNVKKTPFLQHFMISIKNLLLFTIYYLLFTFLFMPYAFIQYQKFLSDISQQIKMNSDPFIFPYTLQYVETRPYLYYLKNIFLWGLGPIISLIALLGFIFFLRYPAKRDPAPQDTLYVTRYKKFFRITNYHLLFAIYYLLFFVIIGRSSVKFMRYMLPLYPFLAMLGGCGLYSLLTETGRLKRYMQAVAVFLIIAASIWTSLFIRIYQQPHTRVAASEWIYANIPGDATIAVEHWDDRLPLGQLSTINSQPALPARLASKRAGRQSTYYFEELALYEQDTTGKWERINQQLARTDYIIIASNRLYTPLTRLTDCEKLPPGRCYPMTAKYYRDLFAERLGFTKIAEFASPPSLFVGSWQLAVDDQSADESFTVYDHPKVMVFKKK